MKDRTRYALQFTGYPLKIADQEKQKDHFHVLKPIAKDENVQTTFIQQNTITNDPRHWDVNWFGSYE